MSVSVAEDLSQELNPSAPVKVRRKGSYVFFTFPYRPHLVEAIRDLPYARYNKEHKEWAGLWCAQMHQRLTELFLKGVVTTSGEALRLDGEKLAPARHARVVGAPPGQEGFAFSVSIRSYGLAAWDQVSHITGAVWVKERAAFLVPFSGVVALRGLERAGVVEDPFEVLKVVDTTVLFVREHGEFTVLGPDYRADDAFQKHFPYKDVVGQWRERGIDVGFADPFTQEVYNGELARYSELPRFDGLKVPLYEYQRRNVAVALQRTGFGIFDEPGLGKSAQGIAVGWSLLGAGEVSRVIVISPAGARTQWGSEIRKFTGESLDEIVIVDGVPDKRRELYERGARARWVVVPYSALTRDKELLRPLFVDALVVADEAHRLKNENAERTKAAVELAKVSKRRLALTGTPLETDALEWFQLLAGFISPQSLGNRASFYDRYVTSNGFGKVATRNVEELHERSRFHFGRHTKAEVASHLPPLRVRRVVLDVEPKFRKVLRTAHREVAEVLRKARGGRRVVMGAAGVPQVDLFGQTPGPDTADLQAVSQLRMLCCSPRLLHLSDAPSAHVLTAAGLAPDEDGPKLDKLREIAQEFVALSQARERRLQGREPTARDVQQERFVVFTFSRKLADLISQRFDADGVPHVLFTGDTSSAARDEAIAKFTDPTSGVLAFVATDAAAEALNLGACCSTLVQFDAPWTPGRAQQRMNRIHRIDGTADRYEVINLTLANTMEDGIFRLLEKRAELQDGVLGEMNMKAKIVGEKGGENLVAQVLDQYWQDNA